MSTSRITRLSWMLVIAAVPLFALPPAKRVRVATLRFIPEPARSFR
ncbi:MAG: hypothetical protein O7A04_12620 [Acidobacteria bacterium]|nr:hypothetical protein [Acidobacteriota bacterium]